MHGCISSMELLWEIQVAANAELYVYLHGLFDYHIQALHAALRSKYPQFAQLHNGIYMQQDAEECWSQLLFTLSLSLKSPNSSEGANTVKKLFGIELVSRVHCAENGEESTEMESVYSLKCHISHEVNHLHEGLRCGLKSELEKSSPSLGRTAIYSKDSRINDLPRILRKVDYPLELDVYDFCSDDLRKRLDIPRRIPRDEEGKKFGLKSKQCKQLHFYRQ
ncbi:deubiquitinating enzyme [Orobanche gracilis]